MKVKTVLAATLFFSAALAEAAKAPKYKAYYIALDTDFYDPPTREVITSTPYVVSFDSKELDKAIANAKLKKALPKNDMKGLRILIVNNQQKQDLYITQDKQIIVDGKEAPADEKIVENIVADIEKKLGSRIKAK